MKSAAQKCPGPNGNGCDCDAEGKDPLCPWWPLHPEDVAPESPAAHTESRPEAWYHADFCHAFAWVYEDGDKLRVRWGERTGSDLYLHSRSDCDRCREIRKDEHVARDGEFTMDKPPEEFSSAESFFHVLVEIAKYVPGLLDEGGDDD